MLEARKVTCVKGQRLLFDQIDLSVRPGEIWQIAGSNGAGKTSLLRILCGLSRPEEGEIFWDGAPVASTLTTFRASLAFLGHAPGIKLDLSARENLEFSNALGMNAPPCSIDEALNEVGLVKSADLLCRYLSEGQRRRVAIARLYLSAARLWILDEPLAAIDHSGIERFSDRLEIHLSEGGLVVLTSHQPLALRHHTANTLALGQAR